MEREVHGTKSIYILKHKLKLRWNITQFSLIKRRYSSLTHQHLNVEGETHWDTLCTNACPLDGKVGSLVESEILQDMEPNGNEIEEEVSVDESMNCASVIDKFEMLLESQPMA